ncbi:hypothetical protein TIFTF001_012472 [Ficus carica]|uniref:Uncharacterized protein n=1 Tax=Ficus carica TaxID=3494 RepID=A0AA88A2E5_FICCA|nr:hypothetical protein TIFTF001_012472 [Ficus carica]
MSSQQIANHQADTEIFHGDAVCKQNASQLFHEMSLPRGLLPLDDLIEVGYNRTTRFVWFKQRKRKEHRFTAIRRTVSYDNEVTAFIEERRMWRLTGVKSKELLTWVAVSEIFINDSNLNKITFTNPTGISWSFAVSAFEINE